MVIKVFLLTLFFLIFMCLYWGIGVGVAVIDSRVRSWMHNHPRWNLNPPINISPVRVTLLWVFYLPSILVWSIRWLFTIGTTVAHKLLLEKLEKRSPK